MMLKDKITSSWDKLLTEKPQGDLMVFYKKRLEHFWRLPDLEKIIGKEKAASAYAAMEEVDVLFEDKAANRCRRLWDRMLSRNFCVKLPAAGL